MSARRVFISAALAAASVLAAAPDRKFTGAVQVISVPPASDGGKSWTMPHSIGVWGLPSHLLRLRDGRILMTYGYRRVPFGIQARTSEDAGRTWSAPLVLRQLEWSLS
jgi:hypothetical protein